MARTLSAALVALTLLATTPATVNAAKPPDTWDGLIRVKAKRVDSAYLLPNADFRPYTKIMMDPTEVAFAKNWQKDYNTSRIGVGGRLDDAEVQKIADLARTGFESIFAKAYADAGYEVVTAAGPDVLRLATAIINLSIAAPDQMTAGRSRTYAAEAGEATVVFEVRDSLTGAVLGRAVDLREAGDSSPYMRTRATNRADFEQLFETWAKISVKGLAELKALSPINSDGQPTASPAN